MKVVLVTGASSGMGKATAKLLAQNGYTVYAAARRMEKLRELEVYGVIPVQMDIADNQSMEKGVQLISEQQGRLDILINNAGFAAYGTIEDMPVQEARAQFEVNLFGIARLIQLVLPKMRENRYGKIVNVTSIGGKVAMPYGAWYFSSKFALEGMSDSLRMELKQFGIDVIVLEPGGIYSEWNDIAMNSLREQPNESVYKEQIRKMITSNEKAVQDMKKSKNSDPIVIAKLVKKSIEANRPKTRYSGGYNARLLLFLRKLLSDKMMDKALMSQMK